jgi:uncharacterized protein (TIGR02611 family)
MSLHAKDVLAKLNRALKLDQLPSGVRRALIGIVGGTILLIGIALIVLPGPAFIVIPIGLAILATEFAWARHSLQKARGLLKKAKGKFK